MKPECFEVVSSISSKMVDYIEDDQKCYLVMEYVKGKSLGEYIRSGERFSIKEIIKYGIEITEIFVYFITKTTGILW